MAGYLDDSSEPMAVATTPETENFNLLIPPPTSPFHVLLTQYQIVVSSLLLNEQPVRPTSLESLRKQEVNNICPKRLCLCRRAAEKLRLVNKSFEDLVNYAFYEYQEPLLHVPTSKHRLQRFLDQFQNCRFTERQGPPCSMQIDMESSNRRMNLLVDVLGAVAGSLLELRLSTESHVSPFNFRLWRLPASLPQLQHFTFTIRSGPFDVPDFRVQIAHYLERIIAMAPKIKTFSSNWNPDVLFNPLPQLNITYTASITTLDIYGWILPTTAENFETLRNLKRFSVKINSVQEQENQVTRFLAVLQSCKKTLQQLVIDRAVRQHGDVSLTINLAQFPDILLNLKQLTLGEGIMVVNRHRLRRNLAEKFPSLEEIKLLWDRNEPGQLKGMDTLNSRFESVKRFNYIVTGRPAQARWWQPQNAMLTFPGLHQLHLTLPIASIDELAKVFQFMGNLVHLKLRVWKWGIQPFLNGGYEDQLEKLLVGAGSIDQLRILRKQAGKARRKFVQTADQQQGLGNWVQYPAGIRCMQALQTFEFDLLGRQSLQVTELSFQLGFLAMPQLREIRFGTSVEVENPATRMWTDTGRLLKMF